MFPPVPAPDLPRVLPVQPGEECGCGHKKRCDPGGDVVEHIVHLCREPPEPDVSVIFIAKHGVHGIHCLVKESQRGSADQQVKKRRGHSVRSILSNCLHGGFRDALLCEILCIPAYDHGHSFSRPRKVSLLQLPVHLPALGGQASRRQDLKAPECLQQEPEHRMDIPGKKEQDKRDQKRQQGSRHPEHAPRCHEMGAAHFPQLPLRP